MCLPLAEIQLPEKLNVSTLASVNIRATNCLKKKSLWGWTLTLTTGVVVFQVYESFETICVSCLFSHFVFIFSVKSSSNRTCPSQNVHFDPLPPCYLLSFCTSPLTPRKPKTKTPKTKNTAQVRPQNGISLWKFVLHAQVPNQRCYGVAEMVRLPVCCQLRKNASSNHIRDMCGLRSSTGTCPPSP